MRVQSGLLDRTLHFSTSFILGRGEVVRGCRRRGRWEFAANSHITLPWSLLCFPWTLYLCLFSRRTCLLPVAHSYSSFGPGILPNSHQQSLKRLTNGNCSRVLSVSRYASSAIGYRLLVICYRLSAGADNSLTFHSFSRGNICIYGGNSNMASEQNCVDFLRLVLKSIIKN